MGFFVSLNWLCRLPGSAFSFRRIEQILRPVLSSSCYANESPLILSLPRSGSWLGTSRRAEASPWAAICAPESRFALPSRTCGSKKTALTIC
jgi:hypothetical protein